MLDNCMARWGARCEGEGNILWWMLGRTPPWAMVT